MTTYLTFIQTILFLFFSCIMQPQNSKTDTGYIIQGLSLNTAYGHLERFTGFNAILSQHSEFYTLSEKELQEFIEDDKIELKELTMIINPHPSIYTLSKTNEFEPLHLNYSNGLVNILNLDDTEVYKIGGKYYIIRKIKYKYIDQIELRYDSTEDGSLEKFNSKDIRLFLYSLELLPSSKSIKKHVWKKKYEFNDFWMDYVRDHLNDKSQ